MRQKTANQIELAIGEYVLQEFEAIKQFFTKPNQVDVGIGDDAALLRVGAGQQLVVSTDMLVAGTHFFQDTPAVDIGWKAMAVNVSDMAAMGATPKWATLAIAMPSLQASWCQAFAEGLFACAADAGVALIGGDTTQGPLTISITLLGEVPIGQAICRAGAKAGDDIWVSGTLGEAALWLQAKRGVIQLDQQATDHYADAMHRPIARWQLGIALRGIASAALDISDGLLADLQHLLTASQVGAVLDWPSIPKACKHLGGVPAPLLQAAVLAGGDDYELCFTAPPSSRSRLLALSDTLDLPLSRIGEITVAQGLTVLDHGQPIQLQQRGYEHFAS